MMSAIHAISWLSPCPSDILSTNTEASANPPLPHVSAEESMLEARHERPGRRLGSLSTCRGLGTDLSTGNRPEKHFAAKSHTSVSTGNPRTSTPPHIPKLSFASWRTRDSQRNSEPRHQQTGQAPPATSHRTSDTLHDGSARHSATRRPYPQTLLAPSLCIHFLFLTFLLLPLTSAFQISPRVPDPASNNDLQDEGDTMSPACADSSLAHLIPPSLQSHPFDSSSHYFSVASNLFCATRPGLIIQRVYLSDNASEVVTDHDTERIKRVCEETLGVVQGTERWGRERTPDRRDAREWWTMTGYEDGHAVEGWYRDDAVDRWFGTQDNEETPERRSRALQTDRHHHQQLTIRRRQASTSSSSLSSSARASSTYTSKSPLASAATSTSRAQLRRGATYSNKEGVWVIDICAIPPELLEQDELIFPPTPPPGVGAVDAALSTLSDGGQGGSQGGARDRNEADGQDGEEDEDEDEDAKALEARRKERMGLMIQALEGTGVQGMSVAGSRKISAGSKRLGLGSGVVGWGVVLGWTACVVLGQLWGEA